MAGPGGIFVKNGQPLSFLNCANTGDATQDKVQLAIQAMLRSVGMDMKIQNYSPTVFGAIRVHGRCETLFHRWIVPPTPGLSRFYSTGAFPPNGFNHLRYDNPGFDRIIAAAESTVDQAKAKVLFWQAQEILAQDLPTLPIFYMYGALATTSRLRGFLGNPTNDGPGWNIEQWSVSPKCLGVEYRYERRPRALMSLMVDIGRAGGRSSNNSISRIRSRGSERLSSRHTDCVWASQAYQT